MRALALALALAATSCAPTWKGKAMQTLNTVTAGVKVAAEFVTARCDAVLHKECIAKKLNPCQALNECHALERKILRDCYAAQSAAYVATSALEASDKITVDKTVAEALQLLGTLRKVLAMYGVTI